MGFGGVATGYGIHSNIVAPTSTISVPTSKRALADEDGQRRGCGCPGDDRARRRLRRAGIRTSAVKDGDGWILNGSKIFITNGYHADPGHRGRHHRPGKGAPGYIAVLVDTSLPGFQKGRKIEKIGQHTSDTAELFFQDVRLPASALLASSTRASSS